MERSTWRMRLALARSTAASCGITLIGRTDTASPPRFILPQTHGALRPREGQMLA